MKKIYLLLLIAASYTNAFTQDPLLKFTHNYFRSDPFKGDFSEFLHHLLKDPSISDKQMFPRTDTSFFYFHGTYTNFNPFFFKPKRIDVLLTEVETRYSSSSATIDTIYVYQLIALTDYTEKGISEVKKEFNRINRQYQKKFYNSKHEDLRGNGKIVGGMSHYFDGLGLAPISMAWGKMEGENSAVLNITLRMKSFFNKAVLPTPFYKP